MLIDNEGKFSFADKSLLGSLVEELGHSGPFSRAELEQANVRLTYCRSGREILNFSESTKSLGMKGSETGSDLSWLRPRDSVKRVNLMYNPLRSLDGIQGLPNLKWIDLRQTMVTDLSPLIGMEKLEAVLAMGAPLDEASYQGEVFEQLSAQGVRVRRSPEDCWQANLRLQATGVRAVYSGDHDEDYFVCAPGLLYSAVPDGATCRITIEQLDAVIAERDDWDLNSFMDRCFEVT